MYIKEKIEVGIITREEMAAELQISVHYLEHHFPRIAASYERRGIKLLKIGKGKSANYGIRKKGQVEARF